MGLALALIFGLSPPLFCLPISFNLFFLACKKKISLFSPAAFILLIARPCVKQRPTLAILSILFIIYTAVLQSAKKPCVSTVFGVFVSIFPARFSGVFCPFFGGVLPVFRGCLAQNSGVYILIVTPLILLPDFISS